MALPSDEILRRMCVGLRVPELKAELQRHGQSDEGRRADLVDSLVNCLRADFEAAASSQNTSESSKRGYIYHVDTNQPMWGWCSTLKGENVFLTSTNGKYGVRNAIIGCALEQGGFEGVCSDTVFAHGKHWFELKAKEPAHFLNLCFISVVDANRSHLDLQHLCNTGDRSLFYGPSRGVAQGDAFVSLCRQNHISESLYGMSNYDWQTAYPCLVCLDADQSRLSFYINGNLVPLVENIVIPGRVAVWSKFKGHTGTLILRTGIQPPV